MRLRRSSLPRYSSKLRFLRDSLQLPCPSQLMTRERSFALDMVVNSNVEMVRHPRCASLQDVSGRISKGLLNSSEAHALLPSWPPRSLHPCGIASSVLHCISPAAGPGAWTAGPCGSPNRFCQRCCNPPIKLSCCPHPYTAIVATASKKNLRLSADVV